MPNYRVFNRYNEDGVGPIAALSGLPSQTCEQVLDAARKACLEATTWRAGEIDAALEKAEATTLASALPEHVVDLALDKWAEDVAFDPGKVEVDKAAWLLKRADGAQAVMLVELTEDPESPCGKSWDASRFTWGAEAFDGTPIWDVEYGENYWGFQNAYELADELIWPDGFDRSNAARVRVPAEFAEETLNVWNEDGREPRAAKVDTPDPLDDEFRARKHIDWEKRDHPQGPQPTQAELDALREQRAGLQERLHELDARIEAMEGAMRPEAETPEEPAPALETRRLSMARVEPAQHAKRSVTADARAAQESARAQSKSVPARVMTEGRGKAPAAG